MSKIKILLKLNKRARKGDWQARREHDIRIYRYARLRERNGLAERVMKVKGLQEVSCEDCLRYLFRATSKDDRRLRSKHFCALCFAALHNVPSKRLTGFIKANDGINGCARKMSEYARARKRGPKND